jgi:hypothetical protein
VVWRDRVSLEVCMTGDHAMSAWRESSSLAAAASGPSNGNHQRHHQRQEERGGSILLGKSVLPYIRSAQCPPLYQKCSLMSMKILGHVGQKRGGQLKRVLHLRKMSHRVAMRIGGLAHFAGADETILRGSTPASRVFPARDIAKPVVVQTMR